MTWVRSTSRARIEIRAEARAVREFLSDVPRCGRLMPSVRSLEPIGDDVYHYVLEEFSNGTVSLAPDYETRFDLTDPAAIRWEPHGEHNFRSWGVFATREGAGPGETVLEIDTHADADLQVPTVMVPLVGPFANKSSAEVTKGFLDRIKAAVEQTAAVDGGRG
ncbi:MAG TPA: SRPBCC family protein [Micromonosporaceae bacterium]|nr:SRPBCC family protein [Micromonosporaceae bacterium]